MTAGVAAAADDAVLAATLAGQRVAGPAVAARDVALAWEAYVRAGRSEVVGLRTVSVVVTPRSGPTERYSAGPNT